MATRDELDGPGPSARPARRAQLATLTLALTLAVGTAHASTAAPPAGDTTRTLRRAALVLGAALATLATGPALRAYLLDGYAGTGIRRLEGSRLAQEGQVKDVKQPSRALLGLADPARPRYAEHRADHRQNVGSVGKLVLTLALIQSLADLYPDDVEVRRRVLKSTLVTADSFSQSDHHTVRLYEPATKALTPRAVRIGDRVPLYEWLDWMRSRSSNAAVGMVMREAMLLRHFGRAYPVPEAEIQRHFDGTPRSELVALFDKTFAEPIKRNGLDLDQLRQGSLSIAGGKARVPDIGESYGTARELAPATSRTS